MVGKVYGQLTAIDVVPTPPNKHKVLRCRCTCGKVLDVRRDALRNGRTQSCGCTSRVHDGQSVNGAGKQTRLYKCWKGMQYRCGKIAGTRHKSYVDKGITVCAEWKSFVAFKKWAEENGYTEHLQLDRINNDGNYEPANCRWVTAETQANNRSTTLLLTIDNQTRSITEWAKILGVSYKFLWRRYHKEKTDAAYAR